MSPRPPSSEQLQNYKTKNPQAGKCTTSHGTPTDTQTASMTAGPSGPILLQDTNLIDVMAHFDRERIPERVVHAKGAGAFGYFEVTNDFSDVCGASLFSSVGKRTDVAVRFSTVGGESGSADTVRDPRGFAIKFYTDQGNWDLVGNNTPIFFIRDPILFPSFIHTQKRNPVTHLKDPDMFWDFISLRPETTHQVSFLFADRGIPDGYRHMNGYGSHTFQLIKDGKKTFCKFHFKTDQGIKNLPADKAEALSGQSPDYSIKDLYNAIASGDMPSWRLMVQLMTEEQAKKAPFNPFDVTKVWPQKEYPLRPVGKMVLDRNPTNYFAEVEQIAFCPSNMPPGIEASPDKMLQGRLFSYNDTHRHRLGANYQQLPVNRPPAGCKNFQRDGPMCFENQAGAPNYFPNSFSGPETVPSARISAMAVSGDTACYETGEDDNFSQVTKFWTDVLDESAKQRLVDAIAGHLVDAQPFIQDRAINNFTMVHQDYGRRVKEGLQKLSERQTTLQSAL